MSHADQCPSTNGPKAKSPKSSREELARVRRDLPRLHGKPVWRSLDEAADSPDFREHLEREFPAGASELSRVSGEAEALVASGGIATGETRRDFLKLMGASMALAGVAVIPGCRRPNHKIMPYSREVPEEIVPGKPLFYATSMPHPDGGAEGLLVETHEGRPTKIEGNPLHSINRGRASLWSLASILSLYDLDRLKWPEYRGERAASAPKDAEPTWDDFKAWAGPHFSTHANDRGRKLAFIVEKKSGPTREALRAAVKKRFPEASWVEYRAMDDIASIEGSRVAFGKPMRPVYNFSRESTRCILSLDSDFLGFGPDGLTNARGFASTRRVMDVHDPMSRLYVIEPGFTVTGGQADHRLRLSPSRVVAAAVELAKYMLPKLGQGSAALVSALNAVKAAPLSGDESKFVQYAAQDLLDATNRGKSLIVAGPSMPAAVHAITHALNAALGNVGTSVSYLPLTDEEAMNGTTMLSQLTQRILANEISTIVCVEANPVLNAPGDLKFAEVFAKVPTRITLSVGSTETAAASTWSLNGTHFLESWDDTIAYDGTIAPTQPMIAPIYEPALSEVEFLWMLAQDSIPEKIEAYEIVREVWKQKLGGADFEKKWRRALFDGVVAGSTAKTATPAADPASVARSLGSLDGLVKEGLEIVFTLGRIHDGRYANCSWLQELPQIGTMVTWDNPVLMSPKTAEHLGLAPVSYSDRDPNTIYNDEKYPKARMADITLDGRTVRAAVWILPGMADDTILATVGYGREKTGRVADGVGFNVYPLRHSSMASRSAGGVVVAKADGTHMIASTQNHWSMEGRTSIVRTADLAAWQKHGGLMKEGGATFYQDSAEIKFGEWLGELAHAPPLKSIYENPYNASKGDAAPGSVYSMDQQWGMTIDLASCTGCGACTVACQSENNIPVVGKREVAKGREMAWMRIDRYFVGDDFNNPEFMLSQPVACVHCENAPCETVCPVNATVHGPEGINYMTYNRCIGTRYCANNCPYKVRRFNFFEYGKFSFNGDYIGKDIVESVAPDRGGVNGSGEHNKININLIPPRLRSTKETMAEIERMGKNPNVSVRMRGVMEKCSYCIQRINGARVEAKLKDLRDEQGRVVVPDGFFQVACQQACPSEAITFGNTIDPKSKVHHTRNHARSYMLLGYLDTRPRTSHMVRINNPNPALRTPVADPVHHEGGHGDGHAEPGSGHAPSEHSYRIDPRKRHGDRGYALSLNVLSDQNAGMGVHA